MPPAMRFPTYLVAAVALALVALLSIPRIADAVWFGAPDLNLPANATFNCTGYPLYGGLYPTGATSCTWYTIAQFGETDALRSNIVPRGIGSITALRIRTGAQSGPMRLTIFKSLRSVTTGAETTCCIIKDESPTFTPPANAVTEIPFARPIPVYNGPESATIEGFDSIAISLLDTSSVIPANYDPSAYVLGAALYPFGQPGQERFGQPIVVDPRTGQLNGPTGPLATRGYQVLLQANWEPAPATPTPTPTPTPVAPVGFVKRTLPVRNGAVGVPLACRLDAVCNGLLKLQTAQARAASAQVATYGSQTFTIAPGQSATVKVKLSARARSLVRKRGKLTVWANATVGSGAQQQTASARLKLK